MSAGTTNATTRVAVLGLYRSGSSAAAGVLHHLGVEMGAPYFRQHFESARLARRLRRWWHEPYMREMYPRAERVRKLGDWIQFLEMGSASHVGAKHPLLSLCGDELVEAWGPDVRFIWTHRPLDESIASIQRKAWWPAGVGEDAQRRLWDEVHRFFSDRDHLRVEFADLLVNPQREVDRIIDYLQLRPDSAKPEAALAWIEPGKTD